MENIIKEENTCSVIKSELESIHPVNNPRIVLNHNTSETIDIGMGIDKDFNGTQITLLNSDSEYLFEYYLSKETLYNIMNYLLHHFSIIQEFNKSFNEINMKFICPMEQYSQTGLTCSEVRLNIKSYSKELNYLIDDYTRFLTVNYFDALSKTTYLKDKWTNYVHENYKSVIELMNCEERLKLINEMNDEELKELLLKMDPNLFFTKYYANSDIKEKALSKKINHNM